MRHIPYAQAEVVERAQMRLIVIGIDQCS